MSARKDTVTIGPNQSVTVTESEAFDFLTEHGHAIEFRLVPDASHFSWLDAKKKLK
jgi:PTS system mannose-specific IIB component